MKGRGLVLMVVLVASVWGVAELAHADQKIALLNVKGMVCPH